jgi:hypothetical protein
MASRRAASDLAWTARQETKRRSRFGQLRTSATPAGPVFGKRLAFLELRRSVSRRRSRSGKATPGWRMTLRSSIGLRLVRVVDGERRCRAAKQALQRGASILARERVEMPTTGTASPNEARWSGSARERNATARFAVGFAVALQRSSDRAQHTLMSPMSGREPCGGRGAGAPGLDEPSSKSVAFRAL